MALTKRMQKFESLSAHGWYGKLVKKLTRDDAAVIFAFCEANRFASPMLFEERANRLFLTTPKTKNWKLVLEVLSILAAEKGDLTE